MIVHTLIKDRKSLWQKCGNYTTSSLHRPIHIHCVSLGEFNACKPLIASLLQTHLVVITSTTQTGYSAVREFYKHCKHQERLEHYYFPFDTRFACNSFIKNIAPQISLMFETEIWPNFAQLCHAQNITLGIINGRMSMKSYQKYAKYTKFTAKVLNYFDVITTQNEESSKYFQLLGYPNPISLPNIKFDVDISLDNKKLEQIQTLIQDKKSIVCASTHTDEEEQIIKAYINSGCTMLLILAPRHPQRFNEVEKILQKYKLDYSKQSDGKITKETVLLADSMGYLKEYYKLCDIAFIGGSLVSNVGGHNILEAMAFDTLVLTGKHTFNFELTAQLLQDNALIQISDAREIFTIAQNYFANDEEFRSYIDNAKTSIVKNANVTMKLLQIITTHLKD